MAVPLQKVKTFRNGKGISQIYGLVANIMENSRILKKDSARFVEQEAKHFLIEYIGNDAGAMVEI
jgi:hypothetical protein